MTVRPRAPSGLPPTLPAGVLPQLLLPFAVPFALTLLLLVTVGEGWPRDIAPGSGLKAAGFIAAMSTAGGIWWRIAGRHADARGKRFAAILCAVTGAMGWPVWTAGVLPSVNGAVLGREGTAAMRLEGLEVTHASKSRRLYYWARLDPLNAGTKIAAGRYFIPQSTYDRWAATRPRVVRVSHAPGLLGAEVVTRYR